MQGTTLTCYNSVKQAARTPTKAEIFLNFSICSSDSLVRRVSYMNRHAISEFVQLCRICAAGRLRMKKSFPDADKNVSEDDDAKEELIIE